MLVAVVHQVVVLAAFLALCVAGSFAASELGKAAMPATDTPPAANTPPAATNNPPAAIDNPPAAINNPPAVAPAPISTPRPTAVSNIGISPPGDGDGNDGSRRVGADEDGEDAKWWELLKEKAERLKGELEGWWESVQSNVKGAGEGEDVGKGGKGP